MKSLIQFIKLFMKYKCINFINWRKLFVFFQAFLHKN